MTLSAANSNITVQRLLIRRGVSVGNRSSEFISPDGSVRLPLLQPEAPPAQQLHCFADQRLVYL